MSKKVLVVDDEEVIRKYLRLQLVHWGYEVAEAADGVQALLKLKNEKFDLIITDIVMPNKDGWALLREVRLDPRTKRIPVILLTTKNQDTDMFKGYELGASYYLPKPFTKEQLQFGIEMMFEETSGEKSIKANPSS